MMVQELDHTQATPKPHPHPTLYCVGGWVSLPWIQHKHYCMHVMDNPLSINELLYETGKLLPKRLSLSEDSTEAHAETVICSEPAVASQQLPLKAEPLPVTNLNFKASSTAPPGSSTPMQPKKIIQSRSPLQKLSSMTAAAAHLPTGHKQRAPQCPFLPQTRAKPPQKSRGLGAVSKELEQLITEAAESVLEKRATSESTHTHHIQDTALSSLRVNWNTNDPLEGGGNEMCPQDEDKKEEDNDVEEEEKEKDVKLEEEEEFADELEDEVPPLECEIAPEERERMKTAIHRRSTLFLDEDIIYFSAEMDKKTKAIVNKYRGGAFSKLKHLTDDVRDDYDIFLKEIDSITFYAYRQAERILSDYTPRAVVLISSAIPKAEVLKSATRPEVLSLVYDVTTETYTSLMTKLKELLNSYKVGAKAKYLAFVCKGGPGYMYLLQANPITPVRLLREESLLQFWKTLGSNMSKLSIEEPAVVHIMESNVAGTLQGTELLSNLEAAMYCHKVKALSPLELEPKGREMIATYFYPEKFRAWKSRRYSKVKLYK